MIKFICFFFLLSLFGNVAFANNSSISGLITEENTKETIIGATVTLHKITSDTISNHIALSNELKIKTKPEKGIYSNKFGFYTLNNLKAGQYILVVRALTYKLYFSKIDLSENQSLKLNINLSEKEITTEQVKVFADRGKTGTTEISKVTLDPEFILKLPSFMSESDVFRSLQLLPGVQSSSEVSSGLYIRGGSPDQNLVLLDDVVIYSPSHMAGFISAFDANALKSVELIKGSMPAEYGGRLSSVIDMTMNEGRKDSFGGTANMSIISSKLTLEGPIDENSSFMISGRRFYLDVLAALMSIDNPYYFYDLYGKVNYKLSDNDHIYLSGYLGSDVLNFDDFDVDNKFDVNWGNKTLNLRWKHIFSSELFSNYSLIYTNYNFSSIIENEFESYDGNNYVEKKTRFESVSDIEDFTFKSRFEYFGISNNMIKTGLELTKHGFTSNILTNNEIIDNELEIPAQKKYSYDLALYLQDEISILEGFDINIGGRTYYFSGGDYFSFEPRLSTSFLYNDYFKFIASYTEANQFLHFITRNDIAIPTDLWFPSSDNIKPSKSKQYIVGTHVNLTEDKEWFLSVEAYYKTMENLLAYRDDAEFTFGIPLEEQFTSGSGKAYGIEFFLQRKFGNLKGFIGYTLAETKRLYPELNKGVEFYPRYDRRHDISLALTYDFADGFEFGLAWIFATGKAYTMPTSVYKYTQPDDMLSGESSYSYLPYKYSSRNANRLPAYHRMDVNLTYKTTLFGFDGKFHINVYNLYNRKNPFSWFIEEDYNNNYTQSVKKVKQFTLFPIIPTIGLSIKF